MTAAIDFALQLASEGRFAFTTDEASVRLKRTAVGTREALRQLAARQLIATPVRGFHVVVPPEYRRLGCLPAAEFVPELMSFLSAPYYAGLLSAAELWGAAHQRPQLFYVVTRRSRPEIRCGAVRVVFVGRLNIGLMTTTTTNTPRGVVTYSTREATAFDLATHPQRCGGLSNVATVLHELGPEMQTSAVVALATAGIVEMPVLQRLGYLFERVGLDELATALEPFVAKAVHTALLAPSAPKKTGPRSARWKLVLNRKVDIDI